MTYDEFSLRLGRLPILQFNAVIFGVVVVATATRYLCSGYVVIDNEVRHVWEPSGAWLTALTGWLGANVGHYMAKRHTDHRYTEIKKAGEPETPPVPATPATPETTEPPA